MFKKRITPFACIITALIVAASTFVATSSALSVKHKADLNQARLDAAKYSDYAEFVDLAGDDSDRYEKLAQMISMIEGSYLRGYDDDALWENVCKSLVETLGDEYSQYFTAEEYDELLDSRDGGFVGIGVHAVRDAETCGIYIYGVIPDSPAEKGGIKKGDIIVAVEGEAASEDNYYSLLDAIRGEAGTELTVTVARGEERLDFTLTRSPANSENVIYQKLDNGIAFIRILSFADETVSEEFADKLKLAQSDGCDKFVFDVRNNLGGDLTEICDVLDMLLPEGPIINIVDKNGKVTTHSSDADCIKGNFVVLCNETTASAAELFTAALRDYGLAKTVGVTTYGKGTVQTTQLLPDGSALKLSTAYYNPPNNESYDGVGIIPDHEIELDEKWQNAFFQMPSEEDVQLSKAIEVLNSQE